MIEGHWLYIVLSYGISGVLLLALAVQTLVFKRRSQDRLQQLEGANET